MDLALQAYAKLMVILNLWEGVIQLKQLRISQGRDYFLSIPTCNRSRWSLQLTHSFMWVIKGGYNINHHT